MSSIKATYVDHMGSDLSVVNAARVSFGKQSEWEDCCGDFENNCTDCGSRRLSEVDTRLIKYLAKHKHLSPFGHAFASFHVKAPIFVARQLVKHKFLRWNEISRRYVDDKPEFYMPEVWREMSVDKKQGSGGPHPTWNRGVGTGYVDEIVEAYYDCGSLYQEMVRCGVAPEQARMVLPQSTMTEWYWSGSLDAFAAMCSLRLKDDTQYESRLVAQQINKTMSDLYPVSWKALLGSL